VVDVEQIFHQHGAYVVRALRYFGVPERELPDVCQEVFVVVHRKLAEFEQRSSIRTWLYRIAQRAASDYRRRAHVRRELVTGEPIDGIQSDERHFDAALDARATLIRALGVLDEDKRAVFVLFEIEGLTMKEIAATLRCPLQTAYSRLHAARKLMLDVVTGEQKGVA
jgi:RNA polymerase sigma-70 factor (ECF subfamily)